MIEQRFSGKNLENSIGYATWEHPEDFLEPEPEQDDSESVKIIRALLNEVFRRPKTSAPLSVQQAFRRWAAMAYVIRPDLFGNLTQTELAAQCGVTRSGLSKLCVWWSNRLGVLNPSMKAPETRLAYSRSQIGHRSYKVKGATGKALNVGEVKRRPQDLTVEERRLAELREDFIAGRMWRKEDKALLRRRGLIDEHDTLSEAGRAWVEDTHPPKESIPPVN